MLAILVFSSSTGSGPVLTHEGIVKEKETIGLVQAGDAPLTLVGPQIEIGDALPDVAIVNQDLQPEQISKFAGKVLIISTVPSLDTPVCDAQTRRFNQETAALGDNVVILTLSNDLPFAQKRYCAAEGIDQVQVFSDYQGQQFGRAVGLFIKENYLLARAVLVVDSDGIVRYKQIVPNLGQEPEYAPVLEAVRSL